MKQISSGEAAELVPGKGCYTAGKFIYSSLLGKVKFSSIPVIDEFVKFTLMPVRAGGSKQATCGSSPKDQPERSCAPKHGKCCNSKGVERSCVTRSSQVMDAGTSLPLPASSPVTPCRLQDVKQGPCDDLQMALCYRPGDYVRAVVISLGDSRSYVLSTGGASLLLPLLTSPAAQDHLGVIYAKREGVQMAVLDANTLM
eukprot:768543-Hanusia_phi.AAC.4